jgi:hypothetical protein
MGLSKVSYINSLEVLAAHVLYLHGAILCSRGTSDFLWFGTCRVCETFITFLRGCDLLSLVYILDGASRP